MNVSSVFDKTKNPMIIYHRIFYNYIIEDPLWREHLKLYIELRAPACRAAGHTFQAGSVSNHCRLSAFLAYITCITF